MATMNRNIPLSIDDELLAEIDRVAEATKESRSAVMRKAIREGMPILKAGGTADVISMDGEMSKDIETISAETKVSRAKVLLECIRAGMQPFYTRQMREQVTRSQDLSPAEAEARLAFMEHADFIDDPTRQELVKALRQRGSAVLRLNELLEKVPEARRRQKLIERLVEIRSARKQPTLVWGAGLSTQEIEWQIRMADTYGIHGEVPDKEFKAREVEREAERQASEKLRREESSAGQLAAE